MAGRSVDKLKRKGWMRLARSILSRLEGEELRKEAEEV